MKNQFLFSIIIFPTLLLFSCPKKVCPPDEKKGDFDLKLTTLGYNPYSGSEKLIFKNSSGDSIVLQSSEGKKITRDRICVKEICTEPKIKGNTTCEYFAGETQRILFSNPEQTILVDFLWTTENYEMNTQKFYSFMRIGLSIDNYISAAGTITDLHFFEIFNQEETVINNFLVEKSVVTLNLHSFQNVLGFEKNPLKFYFTKAYGLVGFIMPTDSYHLDRIE